jgi:hypothetical protein
MPGEAFDCSNTVLGGVRFKSLTAVLADAASALRLKKASAMASSLPRRTFGGVPAGNGAVTAARQGGVLEALERSRAVTAGRIALVPESVRPVAIGLVAAVARAAGSEQQEWEERTTKHGESA